MGASIALAESGANVTLVSRTEKELKDLTDHINNQGFKGSYEVMDVNNEDEVSNFINNAEPFDILINNAGITRDNLLMRMQEEDFDKVIEVNLKSVFNMTKAIQRTMLKQRFGSIINMSSVVGVKGNAGQSNYAASKAGIIGFS